MSVSARARHVLSTMLIVVFASSVPAWAPLDRTTHCSHQVETCSQDLSCAQAVFACCHPPAPIPLEQARPSRAAPPPAYGSTASLMDDVTVLLN